MFKKRQSKTMSFIIIVISFLASVIGAVCGIGGGIIIKPAVDAFSPMSVETVSFLSGLTVLCMAAYSVVQTSRSKESRIKLNTALPVSIGAAAGGITGNQLFRLLRVSYADAVGSVQAACLFVLTFLTLVYTVHKHSIRTHSFTNSFGCALAGLFLGIFSSLLGIGGGPFNLVLLSFLFSMKAKDAAQNSLFIILCSQFSNLLVTIITATVPAFNPALLAGMVFAGVTGAEAGRRLNRKLDDRAVDTLFRSLTIVIMALCVYNFFQYMGSAEHTV
jgi:uncharacterized membrane protein YfcA